MDVYEKRFDELYETYADAIFRHLYFRLGSRERALDLTQEVFTRTWEYLSSGKKIESPKAFLYRSAHNAYANELRAKRPVVSLEKLMEQGFEVPYEDREQEDVLSQEVLVQKLSVLPEASRDVFIMRYIDGMAVKDIAKLMGESENTISARLVRGRKKLRETYE